MISPIPLEAMQVETRYCGDCLHFKKTLDVPPVCKKRLMAVLSNLRIAYYPSQGSCWTPKEGSDGEEG